jgi:pimeloyl-ACP methyl ester carboxylesterase
MELMRVEVSPGTSLSTRYWPSDGDVPYLLVHGLSSNARLWDGVARVISGAGYPVYAVDLRSHGESDAPPEGYDTETAANDLAIVCDRLALKGCVVAGQSWGGNVVVRLAARHPDLVRTLALVDGGWIDLSGRFADWEAAESALRPPEIDGLSAVTVRGYLRDAHPDWSDDAIDATLSNLRIEPDGTVRRRLNLTNHMAIARSMWDDPPWPDYSHITAPVLLIPAVAAEPPTAADPSPVERAANLLSSAVIRPYPGGDHDLHAQHPEQLAADLLSLVVRS